MDEHVMRPEQESSSERPELARLADGSLPADRRRALEDEVARSPELGALLAEQQLAASVVRGLDVTAPASLRAGVERTARERSRGRRGARRVRGGRPRPVTVGTVAFAVLAVALAFALPNGSGGPSVVQAANLSQLAPTGRAPEVSSVHDDLLTATESGVPYPNWQRSFKWQAVGVRTGTLAGRHVTTVYYQRRRSRIGYTIVSGAPLSGSSSWQTVNRAGVVLHVHRSGSLTIVTWERGSHSCVLSGRHVRAASLMRLASWHGAAGTIYSAAAANWSA